MSEKALAILKDSIENWREQLSINATLHVSEYGGKTFYRVSFPGLVTRRGETLDVTQDTAGSTDIERVMDQAKYFVLGILYQRVVG